MSPARPDDVCLPPLCLASREAPAPPPTGLPAMSVPKCVCEWRLPRRRRASLYLVGIAPPVPPPVPLPALANIRSTV